MSVELPHADNAADELLDYAEYLNHVIKRLLKSGHLKPAECVKSLLNNILNLAEKYSRENLNAMFNILKQCKGEHYAA